MINNKRNTLMRNIYPLIKNLVKILKFKTLMNNKNKPYNKTKKIILNKLIKSNKRNLYKSKK